jgi:hypothetical protein
MVVFLNESWSRVSLGDSRTPRAEKNLYSAWKIIRHRAHCGRARFEIGLPLIADWFISKRSRMESESGVCAPARIFGETFQASWRLSA